MDDRNGQPQEKTPWHRVLLWDSLPATFGFVDKHLRQDDRVYLESEIDYRSYETDSGEISGALTDEELLWERRAEYEESRDAAWRTPRSTKTSSPEPRGVGVAAGADGA